MITSLLFLLVFFLLLVTHTLSSQKESFVSSTPPPYFALPNYQQQVHTQLQKLNKRVQELREYYENMTEQTPLLYDNHQLKEVF